MERCAAALLFIRLAYILRSTIVHEAHSIEELRAGFSLRIGMALAMIRR